jgi:hypothetical protein
VEAVVTPLSADLEELCQQPSLFPQDLHSIFSLDLVQASMEEELAVVGVVALVVEEPQIYELCLEILPQEY